MKLVRFKVIMFLLLGILVSKSSANELVTGIDSNKLFEKILPSFGKSKLDILSKGISYSLEDSITKERIRIVIAVYENTSLAERAISNQAMMISVSPEVMDRPIGNEVYCWGSKGRGGTILLRRDNVVFDISSDRVAFESLLDITRNIDSILQNSNSIVERGAKVTIPRLKKINIPATVPISSKQVIDFDLEQETKNMDILVGSDSTNVIWTGGNKVTYHSLTREGDDSFELVLATKRNVVSRIKVQLRSVKTK